MRKYILMLGAVVLVAVTVKAQYFEEGEKVAEKLSKKELRKQKRLESKEAYEINKAYGINLIENRDFVLQANQIRGKRSVPIVVDKGVNFIKIDGDQMIVQYGLNSVVGLNGLGGATFEGTVRQIETNDWGENKGYNVRVQFYTPSLNGIATVDITLMGDQARASLWSNGRLIRFDGDYGSNEETRVATATNRRLLLAN